MQLFTEYLAKRGIHLSNVHKKICVAAFDMHDHFTLEDLCARFQDICAAQVEAVLSQLVCSGLVRKVIFREDNIVYEHVYGHIHHDHLVCLGCGKIEEFTHPDIEINQADVAKEYGFKMLRHSLRIEGLCSVCRKKSRATDVAPPPKMLHRAEIPLSMIGNGERVRVALIRGGREIKQRLFSMGLCEGDDVEILKNTFAGPLTIRVKDCRIAVGHGIAHKIFVKRNS